MSMSESLDEQLANSGKDIFMLQSSKEALDFWNEPARAKIVLVYLQGCGHCHRFSPEFIKMAPVKANSDLLFGTASHTHVNKVVEFIPALAINGFPTVIMVDQSNKVRHVIPGYVPAHNVIDLLEAKFPELRGLPSLQYLQVIRRESLAQEQKSRAAASAASATQPGPVFVSRARLPSRSPPPSSSSASSSSADAKIQTSDSKSGDTSLPPDVTAGSGVVGQEALPAHLRQNPPPLVPANSRKAAAVQRPQVASVRSSSSLVPIVAAPSGGRKHKSKHRRTAGAAAANNPNPNPNDKNNSPEKSAWCTIL